MKTFKTEVFIGGDGKWRKQEPPLYVTCDDIDRCREQLKFEAQRRADYPDQEFLFVSREMT